MVSLKGFANILTYVLTASLFLFPAASVEAQTKRTILSIGAGVTGGVYYVMGGGIAQLISKYIPNTEATAEVTAGTVDNLKLIGIGKQELGIAMADSAYDALKGTARFKAAGPAPIRTIANLYSAYMHLVATEGSGIKSVSDLKGKRVAIGAPGSGTEVMTARVLESFGMDAYKDIKPERLVGAEATGAMKDRKIDAFFWSAGYPAAAVLDLASTPGIKVKFLSNADQLEKLYQKYGPIYYKVTIPKTAYPGMDADVQVAGVANILVCHEKLDADLVYNILKMLLVHQPELVAVHKEAMNFTLATAAVGSPVPFHPGAIRYFREKGIKVQ